MIKRIAGFLFALLLVLIIVVLAGCHVLDYSYSDSKGKTTLKSEELSTRKIFDVTIKEKSNLEFGYSDFEITEGRIILKLIFKDDIIFEEVLTKDSQKENKYKLKNLEPGEYFIELLSEEAKGGKITIYWKNAKISIS